MEVQRYSDHFWIKFGNGIAVEVLVEDGWYKGLGRVKSGRYDLRSPELPILPMIVTEGGLQAEKYEFDEIVTEEEGVSIVLRPYLSAGGHREDGSHLWDVYSWNQRPCKDRGGQVVIRLQRAEELVAGLETRGFSYSYRVRSRKYDPILIHDRATWELNGRATHNTICTRGNMGCPVKKIANQDDQFSTACYRDSVRGHQFRVLFGDLPGFGYQFNNENVLITAFERPFPCFSLIEKPPGKNYIVHWHQLRNRPSSTGCVFESVPMRVLCRGHKCGNVIGQLNQYERVRSYFQRTCHKGVKFRNTTTSATAEIVLDPASGEDTLARAVSSIAGFGCRHLMVTGRDGGFLNGKREETRHLLDSVTRQAKTEGLRVGLVLSVEDIMLYQDRLAGAEGCLNVDDITQGVQAALSLDEVFVSIGPGCGNGSGIGPGGYCRLYCGGDMYRPEIADLHRDFPLACIGKVSYDYVRGNELMYRNMGVRFPYSEIVKMGDDPHVAYFRGCASGLCYRVLWSDDSDSAPDLKDWWDHDYTRINQVFNAVSEYMEVPELLTGGRGILWHGHEQETEELQVLCAFKSFPWDVEEGAKIYNVTTTETIDAERGCLAVEKDNVYLLQPG
jgi:hypothetical protein